MGFGSIELMVCPPQSLIILLFQILRNRLLFHRIVFRILFNYVQEVEFTFEDLVLEFDSFVLLVVVVDFLGVCCWSLLVHMGTHLRDKLPGTNSTMLGPLLCNRHLRNIHSLVAEMIVLPVLVSRTVCLPASLGLDSGRRQHIIFDSILNLLGPILYFNSNLLMIGFGSLFVLLMLLV